MTFNQHSEHNHTGILPPELDDTEEFDSSKELNLTVWKKTPTPSQKRYLSAREPACQTDSIAPKHGHLPVWGHSYDKTRQKSRKRRGFRSSDRKSGRSSPIEVPKFKCVLKPYHRIDKKESIEAHLLYLSQALRRC